MKHYSLNTGLVFKTILGKLAETPGLTTQNVLIQNPTAKARFPCVVVSDLLPRQKYSGWSYDFSLKVEVWADDVYKAMDLADKVREQLTTINLKPNLPTPEQFDDITKKWRFGNYYECRWNAITNTFDQNR
ncbi:hypothetical protein [Fumia xinanensis]|uniref:Uncharacterized protein n=1 Tax=Fumia xinanensis TaxID=2763659 RepID=A0A926E0V5_9FIRM|nr:hypothetical protein [Fumia xinanensis]MBC8558897.1 hypothetical protein [Fumia xinanensis]